MQILVYHGTAGFSKKRPHAIIMHFIAARFQIWKIPMDLKQAAIERPVRNTNDSLHE
jgi:hypothetical protein